MTADPDQVDLSCEGSLSPTLCSDLGTHSSEGLRCDVGLVPTIPSESVFNL